MHRLHLKYQRETLQNTIRNKVLYNKIEVWKQVTYVSICMCMYVHGCPHLNS